MCSAFSAALGAAFQDREIATISDEQAKGARLILSSISKPMWWFGLFVMVGSPVFQYLALRVGNLTQVQPMLTTELLFVLAIIVVTHHQRPGLQEWTGSIGIVAGLSLFLVSAHPSGDQSVITRGWAVAITIGALALVGLFYGFSRRSTSWLRSALMGSAAATCFAYQAAMTQIVAGVSITKIFTQPALIGLAVAGVAGFLFFQHALRDGHIAASRAAMVIVDPLLSVFIGVVAFSDQIGHTPAAITGEVIGLVLLVVGARQLATSPMIAETGIPAELRPPPGLDPSAG